MGGLLEYHFSFTPMDVLRMRPLLSLAAEGLVLQEN